MILKVPIFNSSIRLYKASKKKMDKIVKRYDLDSVKGYDAFVFKAGDEHKYEFVAVFRKGLNSSIIVHEANHLKNHLFIRIGQDLDAYNDEIESYLLDWLYEEIKKWYETKK